MSKQKTPPAISEAEILDWLRERRAYLNLTAISETIEWGRADFSKWISGSPNGHGSPVKIPARVFRNLLEFIDSF